MVELSESRDQKRSFSLILFFLIATDFAILLNIPFLRQIFGFLFLTILPGVLILHILKLNKVGYTEKIVLSVGLSISFLMLFGILINNLSLALGYETPLATIPLLVSFNIAFILFAIIGYKTNKVPFLSLPNLTLSTSEKAFLIVPILFPALSIFGMHVMNTTDNNIVLMFLLFLIPIYVIFVSIFNQKFPERIYPVVILLISISLLLLLSLRSNHIIGTDTHIEYHFFQMTLNNLHWDVGGSTLHACLSISLLPTLYQSLLNVPSVFLFKILYSTLFSISPLIVYTISQKYINDFYSFLSSFFLMSQVAFLSTELYARTNLAILFFILAIMVLFHDGLSKLCKTLLFFIFAVSCILSHYSTTYIFFFILLFTWIGMQILPNFLTRRRKNEYTSNDTIARVAPSHRNGITLTFVALFFAILFFWYSQITSGAFDSGIHFMHQSFINLNQFFVLESRSEGLLQAMGQGVSLITQKIKFVVYWLSLAYIAIGIIYTMVKYKEMVSIPSLEYNKPDFLRSKIETEYFIISIVCVGILACSVILPYIFYGYDMGRVYFQMVSVLPIFFVIGGITIANFLKLKSHGKIIIILGLLVLYFMCSTSTINPIFDVPGTITLDSEGDVYNNAIIYDEECCAAAYLRNYTNVTDIKVYADKYGRMRLKSLAGNPYSADMCLTIEKRWQQNVYLYLRYYNIIDGKLTGVDREHDITEYQDKIAKWNKIYNNGGSEVWG